jgi:hypothetical protein
MGQKLKGYEIAGRSIRALGWFQFIAVAGIYAAIFIPMITRKEYLTLKMYLLLLTIILPIFSMYLGKAVKEHKPWAYNIGIIYCFPFLVGFPLGTIIGACILYYLIKGWND